MHITFKYMIKYYYLLSECVAIDTSWHTNTLILGQWPLQDQRHSLCVMLREETNRFTVLTVNAQYTNQQSHLLHFGYHVIIDDIHVWVRHPQQYFDQHLSLLSSETCWRKTFMRKINNFWLTKHMWCGEFFIFCLKQQKKQTVFLKESNHRVRIKKTPAASRLWYIWFQIVLKVFDGGTQLWNQW